MELNKIHHGDCLAMMATMPEKMVDITVTSPPYNLKQLGGQLGRKKKGYYADDLQDTDYFEWVSLLIEAMMDVTKHHVFFNIQEVSGNRGIIRHLYGRHYEILKETFVWAKTNPPSMGFKEHDTMLSRGFEYIFCFSHDKPETSKFTYCNFSQCNGDYVKTSLISSVSQGYPGHNCVFPEHIPLFFIKNFSKDGDVIYDPFMGSGTTAIAAHKLNRKWIGSEISAEYVDLANKRLEPYLAQGSLFAGEIR